MVSSCKRALSRVGYGSALQFDDQNHFDSLSVETELLIKDKFKLYRNYSEETIDSIEKQRLLQSFPYDKSIYNIAHRESINPKSTLVRFYILFLFSCFTFIQGLIWNTWGPIADSAELVYNWDKGGSVIALLANWGAIAFIPGAIIFPFVINKFGLRYGLLLAMGMVWVGSFIRCFTTEFPLATYIMHVAHFLNGLAGPVSMGATTTVSANWFPYNERTFATGFSLLANSLGVALSFIIGPLMVDDVTVKPHNASTNASYNSQKQSITYEIYHMLYVIAAFCTLVLILIILYFPSKPKHAPSITANIQRSNPIQSFNSIIRNWPFMLLCIMYGIMTGVNSSWSSYLYPNLSKLKGIVVTEKSVGWLGFYMTLSGSIVCLLTAIFSDYFARLKKPILILSVYIAALLAFLFTFICEGIFNFGTYNYAALVACGIIMDSAINATVALFCELSAEMAFPVPEATATILLTLMNNLAGLLFLGVAIFPQINIGTAWMNWAQAAAFYIVVPLICVTPMRYGRLNRDTNSS